MHARAAKFERIMATDWIINPYINQSISAVHIKCKVGKEIPSCFFLTHTSLTCGIQANTPRVPAIIPIISTNILIIEMPHFG